MGRKRKWRAGAKQHKKIVTPYKQKNDKPNWIRRILALLISEALKGILREYAKQIIPTLHSKTANLIEQIVEFIRDLFL